MNYEEIHAKQVTRSTLVGYSTTKFPIGGKGGNCFSVLADDKEEYRILNFGLENLEELQRRGLKFPLRCVKIDERRAAVCDKRIGKQWYSDCFCEVCTPISLLPAPQRIEQLRQIELGARKEHEGWCSFRNDVEAQFP